MNKMKFALIGCGRISKNHIEAIQANPVAELVAVSYINPIAVNRCVEQTGCKGYAHYHDMLEDNSIDVVCICTPSGMHARMAIDAINAGKHVLVEKPMAMSLERIDIRWSPARRP